MDNKKTGELGEKLAETYLEKKGYEILDKNYAPRFVSGPLRGEIDIIAKRKDTICFVEVKTLLQNDREQFSANFAFRPEEKVNFQKQRKIIRTVESWLLENKIFGDVKMQIDVIAIVVDPINKKAEIKHFENVAGV